MTINNFIKEQVKQNMKYVGKIPRKKKKELTTYLRWAFTQYREQYKQLDRVLIVPYFVNPKYRLFDGATSYIAPDDFTASSKA